MNTKTKFSSSDSFTFCLALAASIFIYGAIPFLTLPTMGQALGTTVGFAQSLLNEGGFSIYAKNFGYPIPMPRSFGLSGVLVTEIFLWIGFSPVDAYTSMAAMFISLAYWGAFRFARYLKASIKLASILALLWTGQPVVWKHAGYSMLSLGIGLLPLYYYSVLNIILDMPSAPSKLKSVIPFWAVCVLAVFMDGYSYMLFACGTIILGLYFIIIKEIRWVKFLFYSAPAIVLGFGFSYLLYACYIGRMDFPPSPIDFFRGWGLDISFILLPPIGVHWLWDMLGLSVARSGKEFFGDSSVWTTVFSAPLVLIGTYAWLKLRRKNLIVTGLFLVTVFGFYMSLGPSLKINSTKQKASSNDAVFGKLMPEDMAVAPTGSAFLSSYVPGFKSMRASYRWYALCVLGLWGSVVALTVSHEKNCHRIISIGLPLFLLITVMPDPLSAFKEKVQNRTAALRFDQEVLYPLGKNIFKGEKIVFLPTRNDLMVNYIAAKLDITTYNVGGDKNLYLARSGWPSSMKSTKIGQIDTKFVERIIYMLAHNEADAAVLLYIDSLRAIHEWPSPPVHSKILQPVIDDLKVSGRVTVNEFENYVLIRPNGKLKDELKINWNGIKYDVFNESNTITQVGEFMDGRLTSTGKRGFLMYGPYTFAPAGKYFLQLKGTAKDATTAWADIVSDRGRMMHARFSLNATDGKDVLAEGNVIINKAITDLEVRVFVTENDKVKLTGYELSPIAAED